MYTRNYNWRIKIRFHQHCSLVSTYRNNEDESLHCSQMLTNRESSVPLQLARKAITSKLAVWMRFNRSLHWFAGAHCYSMLHGSGGKNNNVHQNSLDDSSTQYGPYFDMSNSKNVTTILGKTTYLNCRVKNLGNKTVSEWSNTTRVNSRFFQSCGVKIFEERKIFAK